MARASPWRLENKGRLGNGLAPAHLGAAGQSIQRLPPKPATGYRN